MARNFIIYNKTHNPLRRGGFFIVLITAIIKIVRCNLNRMTMFF
nr:MAG TPA: hypothetical protein [Caudoviricetes sp.]